MVFEWRTVMNDINSSFVNIEPINKGWSNDKKYCVINKDRIKYLLRVSPIEQYERKRFEFEMMQRVAALGVPMCQPIEFGTCEDNALFKGGVYMLLSWIDGEDAQDVICNLYDNEQ